MKISTKGRYALRMMLDLARHQSDGYVALKDVAERQDISKKYLEQIVPLLNRAGLLRTTRGYQGGYMLTKSPDSIMLGDVLRVTEGNLAPVACLESKENYCDRSDICETLFVWQGLYDVITKYVDSISLQDIIDREDAVERDSYII